MNSRSELGISQKDYSAVLGVSVSAVSMNENGHREMPAGSEKQSSLLIPMEGRAGVDYRMSDAEHASRLNAHNDLIKGLLKKKIRKEFSLVTARESLRKLQIKITDAEKVFYYVALVQDHKAFNSEIHEALLNYKRVCRNQQLNRTYPKRKLELEMKIVDLGNELKTIEENLEKLRKEAKLMVGGNIGEDNNLVVTDQSNTVTATADLSTKMNGKELIANDQWLDVLEDQPLNGQKEDPVPILTKEPARLIEEVFSPQLR